MKRFNALVLAFFLLVQIRKLLYRDAINCYTATLGIYRATRTEDDSFCFDVLPKSVMNKSYTDFKHFSKCSANRFILHFGESVDCLAQQLKVPGEAPPEGRFNPPFAFMAVCEV